MKKLCVILILLLLLVPSSALAEESATIGTWNLGGNNAPLSEWRLRQQARVIARFKPDLLVLTEVKPHSAAKRLGEILTKEQGLAYTGFAIDQDQTSIDIGILHTQGATVSQKGLIKGTDLDHPNARQVLWADVVLGGFDFRVYGVHLKSSYESFDIDMREEQAKLLADHLNDFLNGNEKDALVIGDYNMFPRRDRDAFRIMASGNGLRFVSSESLCWGPQLERCRGTHLWASRVGNMLDGFGITPDAAEEYRGEVRIIDVTDLMGWSHGWYRSRITDHYPIVADFRVGATDADDGPTVETSTDPVDLQYSCRCECEGRKVKVDVSIADCELATNAPCKLISNGETVRGQLSYCRPLMVAP